MRSLRGLLQWFATLWPQAKPFLQALFALDAGLCAAGRHRVGWNAPPADVKLELELWERLLESREGLMGHNTTAWLLLVPTATQDATT